MGTKSRKWDKNTRSCREPNKYNNKAWGPLSIRKLKACSSWALTERGWGWGGRGKTVLSFAILLIKVNNSPHFLFQAYFTQFWSPVLLVTLRNRHRVLLLADTLDRSCVACTFANISQLQNTLLYSASNQVSANTICFVSLLPAMSAMSGGARGRVACGKSEKGQLHASVSCSSQQHCISGCSPWQ